MVQQRKFYNKRIVLSKATELVYARQFKKALNLVKKELGAAHYNYLFFKGWIAQLEGHTLDAIKWFEKSLKINPINEYSLEGLVGCYIDIKQYDSALECAEQLLLVNKDSAKNKFVLATAESHYYRKNDNLEKVLDSFINAYDAAIKESNLELLKDILIGWGACLVDLRRFKEAQLVLESVKTQDNNNILIHKNLASVYAGLNLVDKAIESCNIAKLSDDPDIANDALYQLGMLNLLKGEYRTGWRLHEFRLKIPEFDSTPTREIPQWSGNPTEKILVYQEQGIGDTIQFSRYLKEVKKRVNQIDIAIQPNTYMKWEDNHSEPKSLKHLLKQSYPEINKIYITGWDTISYSQYDAIISFMSLPRVFKTTLANIPSIPYFKSKETSILKTKSDIGIFWRGSNKHANDRARSIPTHIINSFIQNNQDKTFVNLQLDRDEDLEHFSNVINAKDYITDITNTLNILESCRLVVTVDSMIAHLAGSANIPTIVLHANAPDWRWLLDRRDCPWYPSVINLRQGTDERWEPVILQLQSEIDTLFKSEILID